mmetsp:Transcript_8383/g.15701  ORF Transcript_8383/g.15701 Transcript_8383/m.15701 type:complete len:489 (+) Transcript_8383:98-1564(+)
MVSVDKLDELYAVLEVPRNADATAIKASYRKLVLKYHPDKNPDNREASEQKIRAINNAYEVLGNTAKRKALESQAAAINIAYTRHPTGLVTVHEQRTADVVLPRSFMICPLGHPGRFLRVVDRTIAFQSRNDVKNVDFEGFFSATRFAMQWLPNKNNPDRFPKFRCPVVVQNIEDFVGSNNSGMATSFRSSMVDAPIVGSLSFGLSPGVLSSDLMLARSVEPACSNVLLIPSPNVPGAYRFEADFFASHFLAFDPPTLAQMSGDSSPFSVMDFVVIASNDCLQFLSADDVMIPAARSLGGDHNYVKLTSVCEDPHVRAFFQRNGIWDFGDFEAYFAAHCETWDYRPDERIVCLRSLDDSKGKGAPKREAPQEPCGKPDAKRSNKSVKFNRDPTRIVCLTNLVGAGEVDEDLHEEIVDEVQTHGKLKRCVIKEIEGLPDHEAVRIFLEFEKVESATEAYITMSGRFFGGRKVKSQFYDEQLFQKNDLEK